MKKLLFYYKSIPDIGYMRHMCHISLILGVWRGQLASLPRKSLHHYQVSQTHTDPTSRQNDESGSGSIAEPDKRSHNSHTSGQTLLSQFFFSLNSFFAWQPILNFGMKGRFPFLGYWTLCTHYFSDLCCSWPEQHLINSCWSLTSSE